MNAKGRRITGTNAFLSAVNRKQIPLCKHHYVELGNNILSPLDTIYLSNKLNIALPKNISTQDPVLSNIVISDLYKVGSTPRDL